MNKFIERYVGKDIFFAGWFVLIAGILALSGCSSTKAPAPAPAAPSAAAESAPITAHEAAASMIQSCTGAIQAIAVASGGDAASKVAAVGAIERVCGQNGAGIAFARAPAAEPPSLGATLWQAGLQVADILLRGYGIKSARDVAINNSNNNATTQIATVNAFQGTAAAGFGSNATIAGLIQAPAPNVTLSGTGVIGSGSYVGPVTRNCVGGSGAAGTGVAGTGTTPGTPGGPGNGGPAAC